MNARYADQFQIHNVHKYCYTYAAKTLETTFIAKIVRLGMFINLTPFFKPTGTTSYFSFLNNQRDFTKGTPITPTYLQTLTIPKALNLNKNLTQVSSAKQ